MREIEIVTLATPSLGARSYLVHDGDVAFVVDPPRDVDRVTTALAEHGVRLTHVLETHLHHDHVTGGPALARATGATYLVNGDDEVGFDRTPVRDGEAVAVGGRMCLTALATPGHTVTHLAYALTDTGVAHDGGVDDAVAVFTGASLLPGATGRPDLPGEGHTATLARDQHASARRLADLLPDTAAVLPTQGAGSFCAAGFPGAASSTIGEERAANPALTMPPEAYVRELGAGLGAWPAYYAHLASTNAAGPEAPDLSPPPRADAAELRARIRRGEWVVDLRERSAFAAGHVAGTLSFGVDGRFATYLGWLIPWGTPLTLLGSADDVARAQRELVRIGIDRPAAHATGSPQEWTDRPLAVHPRATYADLADVRQHRGVVLLDVRREEEHAAARVLDSVNVPLHELPDRRGDVPPGEVWVHCGAGYRAGIASSLLGAAGRQVVAVDDALDQAGPAGLALAAGAD